MHHVWDRHQQVVEQIVLLKKLPMPLVIDANEVVPVGVDLMDLAGLVEAIMVSGEWVILQEEQLVLL